MCLRVIILCIIYLVVEYEYMQLFEHYVNNLYYDVNVYEPIS